MPRVGSSQLSFKHESLQMPLDRRLLERVPIADHVDERDEDVEAGAERAVVFAQPLDHVGRLLRHHDRGSADDEYHQRREHQHNNERTGHSASLPSL